MRALWAWLSALALLSASAGSAEAQRRGRRAPRRPVDTRVAAPPRVLLRVAPLAGSLRWTFALENTADEPIETVADRGLLWLEIEPGAVAAVPPPSSRRGRSHSRRVRAPTATRCVPPGAPRTVENAHRVSIPAHGTYTEGFDLRELCGLRIPANLVPGARLTVHYGFRGARSFERAVVLDGSDPPASELVPTAGLEVPATAATWPPEGPTPSLGDPRISVTTHGSFDAASLDGLSVNARIRLDSPYPMRTFFRPGQFRFEFIDPQGRSISCHGAFRNYAPIPDFFVRLTHGRTLSETVQLGMVCPPQSFTFPGIYRGQAIYESHVPGEIFGFHAFTGASGSPYFFVRISHGPRGMAYRIQSLIDPFGSTATTPAASEPGSPAGSTDPASDGARDDEGPAP